MGSVDDLEAKPASTLDDHEDLLRRLHAWEQESRQAHSRWKDQAKQHFDFVAGEQWSPEDKAIMMEEMRPAVVFNRSAPMVDAVTGAEVLNRQQVQYYPREVGDAKVSEMMTAAADYARDNCDAEDQESDAFSDLVICGMGWTETFMDYDETPEGDIRVPRVDPLEMGWDPRAKQRNLTDSRYRYRVRNYDKDDFKARFGKEMYTRVLNAMEDGDGLEGGVSQDVPYDEYRNEGDSQGKSRQQITVVQMQWWDLEDVLLVQGAGGLEEAKPESVKQIAMMALMNGMQPPSTDKRKMKRFYQAVYAGNVLISKKPLPCPKFTFNCMTGKRDRNTNTWYGLVRAMIDPQMWANKVLSQSIHIMGTSAKGGAFFETGAFKNQKKAEKDFSKPGSLIELQPGTIAGNRLQEKQGAQLPPAMKDMLAFAVESLPNVTGINLEMLGLVQREQAGVLEAQRKRSGYAILAVFFDALRRYRKEQGRVMLEYIDKFMSDGRLIRIKGDDGQQYVPLFRQPGVTKYDVVVDEAPMSQNQKDQVWGMLMQMAPMLKDAPPAIWGELLEYSPLPTSLAAKIKEIIAQPQQPDPAQQAMQQLEMADRQAEVGQKEASAQLDAARAQAEMIGAQRDAATPIEVPQPISPA